MLTTVSITTLDLRKITVPQARMIGELLAEVWPRPGVKSDQRAEKLTQIGRDFDGPDQHAPRSFVVFELGRVIAHACIVPRTIAIGSNEVMMAGLSRVCTDARYRGRGLGEVVARAVFERVDRGDFPLSLFQTSNKVERFYEKLGCVATTNRIVNSLGEDPEANPFWDEVAMRYPASGAWSDETIDLRGAGF